MAKAVLTLTSKNYSSWSLRGWLLAKFAGLDFTEKMIAPDDPEARAEILLLSSSILVPRLEHDGARLGIVRGDHLLGEVEAGELRQQPAAQRPRRIVLAGQREHRLGHGRPLLALR